MLGRKGIAFASALLVVLVSFGCGDSSDPEQLAHDPGRAPIVFLPGLVASDLGCGESGSTTNLWPGATTEAATWNPPFGDLALVNTEASGQIESRTTSSTACGSESFRSGTVAEHEPEPLNPTWCLPEEQPVNRNAVLCAEGFIDVYSTFALALRDQSANRTVVTFAWDWRKSPAEEAKRLDREIRRITDHAGVKATVVAHSFGNILFREWMRQTAGAPGDLVGRFLSVAGPWWGVAEAWTHPAFGQIQPGLESLTATIGTNLVEAVFQSSPGIYWLMPTERYDEHIADGSDAHWLAAPDAGGASQWTRFDDVADVVDEQFTSCPQSETFPCRARELYELAAAAAPATGFDTGGIRDFVGVVGAGLDTAGQICSRCTTWPDGGAGDDSTGHIRYVNGDGNVPVFSAIQGTDPRRPAGDRVPFLFTCGINHAGLMTNVDVLTLTIPFLVGSGSLTTGGVFDATPCDVGTS